VSINEEEEEEKRGACGTSFRNLQIKKKRERECDGVGGWETENDR
jgi:hypothetical protein